MAQRPELWGAASKWQSGDLSLEPVTLSCKSLFGSALGPCAVNKWGVYDVHPSQPWVLPCLLWSGHESPSPHDHLSGPCSSLGVLFISGPGAGLSYKIWFPNVAGKKKKKKVEKRSSGAALCAVRQCGANGQLRREAGKGSTSARPAARVPSPSGLEALRGKPNRADLHKQQGASQVSQDQHP